MARFLHTADWQIGRRYAQFDPDDAVLIAEQRLLTIERLAALATARSVDAVLVAGDVFDAQTVGEKLIRRLFAALQGFAGPWIMISGNHDAALGESVWTQAQRLAAVPSQVRLALEPGVVELPACRTALLVAPLTQRYTYDDSTAFFDEAPTPEGWLRIGVAHGSLAGILPDSVDSANPIAATRRLSARLDYLALGDWHGLKQVDAHCAYSGTPEQDRFVDNAPGHCLIVDVAAPGATPVVEPVRVGRYRWRDLSRSVRVPTDIDEIERELASLDGDDIVELAIEGHCDLAGHERLVAALGRVEARVRSLRLDLAELRLLPSDEDLASLEADGYLADVIAALRAAQQQGPAPAGGLVNASGNAPGNVPGNVLGNAPADMARVASEALAILCAELSARRGPRPTASASRAGPA